MCAMPGFDDFYHHLHGREPFPWQHRLAEQVFDGSWPSVLDIPTGMGKTAALDIAVWALATQADRHPDERTAPTRIWYVVNRRLLVDTAADHADTLAERLAEAPVGTPLGDVAAALRSLHGGDPLWVSRLRGGLSGWTRPPSPAHPAVLCATVPMYGSRLLFRGYGTSNRMWPIDAALAGTDSLVLLDESHLAPALIELLSTTEACDASTVGFFPAPGRAAPTGSEPVLPPGRNRPHLVELSATTTNAHGSFELDDTDRSHTIISHRLSATKPTSVIDCTKADLVERLCAETISRLAALTAPGAALVFTNRPRTARQVATALTAHDVGDVVVLTGQLRDLDAQAIRERLVDPIEGAPAGRPIDESRDGHLVIVATQTLEVGADLDVDVLVTEAAGTRALTQRFGRLNRLGDRPWASAAIVFPDEPDLLYGDEPARVRQRLGTGPIDLCPDAIARELGDPCDTDRTYVPALLPHHLREFAKTSLPPAGAAAPELFFSGIEDPTRTVTIAWRGVLPPSGEVLFPALHSSETVDVPVKEVLELLEHGATAMHVGFDGASIEPCTPDNLAVGQRVILDSTAGFYTESGWDPSAPRHPVRDLSPRLRSCLHLTTGAIRAACATEPPDEITDQIEALVFTSVEADTPPTLTTGIPPTALVDWLTEVGVVPEDAEQFMIRLDPAATIPILSWRLPSMPQQTPALDALDELSTTISVDLADHLMGVGELAAEIARSIGLSDHRLSPEEWCTSGRA